jgi:hypothetical protein
MNKYLLLSAAALLASTASAALASNSGSQSIFSPGDTCPMAVLHWKGPLYAVRFPACGAGSSSFGAGVAARKTPGVGRNVPLASVALAKAGVGFDGSFVDFTLPLKNGGTWREWATTNGATTFLLNTGTYQLTPGAKRNSQNSMVSATIAALREHGLVSKGAK